MSVFFVFVPRASCHISIYNFVFLLKLVLVLLFIKEPFYPHVHDTLNAIIVYFVRLTQQ